MSLVSRLPFHSEEAAFEYLEKTLWPAGPVCPHCGTFGTATKLAHKGTGKRPARIGLWKCNEKPCRKQFTVKVGTVFEHGRIPLHKMLQAVYLLCCSKKGISSHQLHRILQIQYKSAWFLSHRIREAMRDGSLEPMGGAGQIVEIDETVIGKQDGAPKHLRWGGSYFRNVVMTLVTRGGSARSFHIDGNTIATMLPIIRANIQKETAVMTDEGGWYNPLGENFASHETVNHTNKEYVRRVFTPVPGGVITRKIHSNTVEGYYSIFKRGMKGVYQHCSEKHLHRYLAEFDFRYSQRIKLGVDDTMRTAKALKGIVGKRLTYRGPSEFSLPGAKS
jgi:transposase-like protein